VTQVTVRFVLALDKLITMTPTTTTTTITITIEVDMRYRTEAINVAHKACDFIAESLDDTTYDHDIHVVPAS
jgi:hypothetical protein